MPKMQKKGDFKNRGSAVKDCLNWYLKDCGGISDEEYKGISEKVWFRKLCNGRRESELLFHETFKLI